MNYQETVDWMFAQLPMFQKQGASAFRKDLTNTIYLMSALGNPEQRVKCIHVAGTNGKGSTAHSLASILQEAGYKVGLYTSPHLKDYRERIRVNGKMIAEGAVCSFIARNKALFEQSNMSFFEMTVGLAFDYFASEAVDIAVIEVGLGGRLDSTNIITPLVSVITNIGLDHTQFLGDTLGAIAYEKAGVIKAGVPVIIGEYLPETKPVFTNRAKEMAADIYFASDLIADEYPSDLKGDYQQHNRKTVVKTIAVLNALGGFKILPLHVAKGLQKVSANTGLRGRWQQLGEHPTTVCDTAHNKDGLQVVMKQLMQQPYKELHIVIGFVKDKSLDDILPLLPTEAKYYFCCPNLPRGLDANILTAAASAHTLKGKTYNSVMDAYTAARANATKEDFIYIGGSTFVVAELPLPE